MQEMGKMIQLPKAVNNSRMNSDIPRLAYNFERVSDTVTELEIYDTIASKKSFNYWTEKEGTEVTPQAFKDEMKNVDTNEIVVRINSAGGETYSANSIAVAIQEQRQKGKKVSCKIDGMCASAAVQIALACNPIMIHRSAYMMIHNPMFELFGYYNANELQEQIEALNSIKHGIMNAYTEKTGLSEEEISRMMDESTYMDGVKAVELGFADSLMFEEEEEEEEVINRMSMLAFNTAYDIPDEIKKKLQEKGAKNVMDRKELETRYPDIINEIRTDAINSVKPVDNSEAIKDAVNAERERMKAIDEMAGKVDSEVLNKAKYETFETAEKVALNAIREGKFVNTAVINAMAEETSAQNNIGGVPNGGVADTAENKKEAEIKNIEKMASDYLKKTGRGA